MNNKNTPAFPVGGHYQVEGMTLRDYFSAKAMQGMLASTIDNHARQQMLPRELVVQLSYQMADWMLKEREKQS